MMSTEKKGKGLSLQARMAMVFTGTLLGLLAALCALTMLQVNAIVTPLTQDYGSQIVKARADQVSQWLGGKLGIMQQITRLDAVRSADIGAIEAFMASRKAARDAEIEDEAYVDTTGMTRDMSGNSRSVADRAYYAAIVQGNATSYISNPVISKSTGAAIVVLAAAVGQGRTGGFYFGTVTLNRLSEIISTVKIGDAGYGFIVDGTGLVVAHPKEEYRMKLNLNTGAEAGYVGLEAVAAAAAKGEGGIARAITPEGVEEVIMYQPIAGTLNWMFAVAVPSVQISAASSSVIKSVLIISVLILVVATLVSVVYAGRIARPVRFLADKATRFSRGEITLSDAERATLKGTGDRSDELGLMGRAFSEMTGYFEETARVAQMIADGDLTVEVAPRSESDLIGTAHAEMVRSLAGLLRGVRRSVAQVTSGADQISQASQSLSQGATEQAGALEEISSSLVEINGQSRQNAESAIKANELARAAAEGAVAGKNGMDELKVAMDRVSASSEKIGTIVKVIDDIAFQINLLALNANVEAARAGKYGKGFAVVADEVRSLAVRSTQAVKETGAMVVEATQAIAAGAKTSLTAGERLDQIVQGSSRVADILGEISQASKEQADKVEQATKGLDQINEVTQSNTSSAEESAAASEELASQARELEGTVARFRLVDSGEPAEEPEPVQPRRLEHRRAD